MRALEPLTGIRVVASPEVLAGSAWPDAVAVLRIAPDDVLVIGTTTIDVADPDAIVVAETGFVGCWLTTEDVRRDVLPHVDWELPAPEERPALAQGYIAGVPAKLWLTGETALLLCAAPYAHDLAERLS